MINIKSIYKNKVKTIKYFLNIYFKIIYLFNIIKIKNLII